MNSSGLAQFIPLIVVAGAIWLILKYLRNKKGISSKDDGSDKIQKAAFKTGKAVNKSILAFGSLPRILRVGLDVSMIATACGPIVVVFLVLLLSLLVSPKSIEL